MGLKMKKIRLKVFLMRSDYNSKPMTTATKTDLKELIRSCDFLEGDEREEWEKKAEKLPQKAVEFTYRKFKDAKKKIESIYISIALQYDPTGGDLVKETLKTIQKSI